MEVISSERARVGQRGIAFGVVGLFWAAPFCLAFL